MHIGEQKYVRRIRNMTIYYLPALIVRKERSFLELCSHKINLLLSVLIESKLICNLALFWPVDI